jgi:uncharacterized membrane protein
MKSTAQLFGHPIHPMLIPYPFALLSTAVCFDVGARITGRRSWARTARNMSAAGLATALAAAVPGILDYFGSVPSGTSARESATTHALCNASAVMCFAVASRTRADNGRLPDAGLALGLLGTGLLAVAGWFGGELVYHHHVGVAEGDPGAPELIGGDSHMRRGLPDYADALPAS